MCSAAAFSLFLTVPLATNDLRIYRTNLRQIFRIGRSRPGIESDRSRDVAMVTNFRSNWGNLRTPPPSFVPLAFRNGLEDWNCNADGALTPSMTIKPARSFIRFGPVRLEFMRLECAQEASISIRISFSTFARGRHC